MTVSNVKFDSLSLWVQIWGAPFNMFSPKVAMEVGSPKSLFQYLNQSGEAVILQDLMGGGRGSLLSTRGSLCLFGWIVGMGHQKKVDLMTL